MNNPQETPKKKTTLLEDIEAIGKVMTLVDMPFKQFKRKEYERIRSALIKMIKDGVVV